MTDAQETEECIFNLAPLNGQSLEKPSRRQGVCVLPVPESDEIQLQSEARMLRLRPCDSSLLLQQLLPLLDGTRTVDQILRGMRDFDESQVLDSLERLYRARLLEDAGQESVLLSHEQQQFYASQLTFFSQFAYEADAFQAALAQSQVAVLGSGKIGCQLLNSLAENGVGQLLSIRLRREGAADTKGEEAVKPCASRNPWTNQREVVLADPDKANVMEAVKGCQIVVLAADGHDPDLLELVNEACIHVNIMWMPVGVRAFEAYVGPTVLPRQTACYKCYDLRMKANLIHFDPYLLYERRLREGRPRTFGALPEFARIVADVAAIETIKLLTNFSPPATCGRMFTIDFLTLVAQFNDVLRLPRCPACGEPSQHVPMTKPWSG